MHRVFAGLSCSGIGGLLSAWAVLQLAACAAAADMDGYQQTVVPFFGPTVLTAILATRQRGIFLLPGVIWAPTSARWLTGGNGWKCSMC